VTFNARFRPPRLPLLSGALLVACCLALSVFATAAGALVVEVGGTRVGIQNREVARYWEGTRKWSGLGSNTSEANAPAASFGNAAGHPVLHSANTYAIFWDPQDFYHGDWQGLIDNYLRNAGGSNGQLNSVFAVDSQYTDATNQPATSRSVFHGGATDTNPYPASGCSDPRPFELGAPLTQVCLSDTDVRAELQTYITQHGLPRGMGRIYYILTPPGVAVCLDAGGPTGQCSDFAGTIKEVETAETKKEEPTSYKSYKKSFCSYHGAIGNGDANTVLYAAIPWSAGGEGDNKFTAHDKAPGYDCQDGGFEPSSQINGELEEKERVRPKTPLEEEEFAEKSSREKREQEEAEALGLAGPHQQEPNQLAGRTPDGGFDTGLADLTINQIAVQQQNIVTNPLLNAWQDPAGSEVTDECRNFFVPPTSGDVKARPATEAGTLANQALGDKSYYLNGTFNLAALRLTYPGIPCLTGVRLVPGFTAPNPVNSGEVVGFDGMESEISLNSTVSFPSGATTYPIYTWNFGDGSPTVTGYAPGQAGLNSPSATPCQAPWLSPCAASTFHEYPYGGTYNVTLSVKDVGGNEASVTNPVTVVGPGPPASPSGGGSSAAVQGSGSSSATPPATLKAPTTSPGAHPAPVATQAVASHSLSSVLKSGLVIRYSVSEQVAGRFEVLLASSIAHKLGLKGAPAGGLAKGTPPQTVIAKAILVTTKGGRNTYKIKFSKTTAAHLRKLHKVTLMIRMVVHNAASPAVTTVLNTVNLSR
jgi:hypothetical protein